MFFFLFDFFIIIIVAVVVIDVYYFKISSLSIIHLYHSPHPHKVV